MTTTNLAPFSLGNEEEVAAFENHLSSYVKDRAGFDSVTHSSLVRARRPLLNQEDGARMFAALVDLRISLALLEQHVLALGKSYNASLPSDGAEPGSIDDAQSFLLRMNIHDHANAFVLRFRSIWDKIMGILVLRFEPSRYESFCSSKSKKASFRKIFAAHPFIPEDFVRTAESIIQSFDDGLRTSEAHGTGTLRKTSFTWIDHQQSPPMALLGYWNFLNEIAHTIGGIFDEAMRSERSPAK